MMTERADAGLLLFGHGCPQHPGEAILRVEYEAARTGGFLVTARYACGHRHTQFAVTPPRVVRDTGMRLYPVMPASGD
jgi:hypothetical protein